MRLVVALNPTIFAKLKGIMVPSAEGLTDSRDKMGCRGSGLNKNLNRPTRKVNKRKITRNGESGTSERLRGYY
jgi:hypothetical protein